MELLDSLQNIDGAGLISTLRVVGLILSILFLGGIIASLAGLFLVDKRKNEKADKHFIRNQQAQQKSPQMERWTSIEKMFKSPDPTMWRMAIIDADTLLDEFIVSLGYPGNTFGERLKSMQNANIPWLQAAWDVHLLRNKLAHEGSRYPLNDREAYRAYRIYQDILFNSGYLA